MISLWFMIGFLLVLALSFILYARLSKIMTLVLILMMSVVSLSLYYYLGNAVGLRNAILLQAFNASAENGENHPEVLQELITGLQKQLKRHPDDPMSLALLAKIYFTLGDYAISSSLYAQAHTLLPDDSDLLIDYVTADYLAKDGKIDNQLELLIKQVKKLPPTLESLSLLANVALGSGDTQQAIEYWQSMQAQLPIESELYQELTLTIEFAKQK